MTNNVAGWGVMASRCGLGGQSLVPREAVVLVWKVCREEESGGRSDHTSVNRHVPLTLRLIGRILISQVVLLPSSVEVGGGKYEY